MLPFRFFTRCDNPLLSISSDVPTDWLMCSWGVPGAASFGGDGGDAQELGGGAFQEEGGAGH
jgi:hypothetical protein